MSLNFTLRFLGLPFFTGDLGFELAFVSFSKGNFKRFLNEDLFNLRRRFLKLLLSRSIFFNGSCLQLSFSADLALLLVSVFAKRARCLVYSHYTSLNCLYDCLLNIVYQFFGCLDTSYIQYFASPPYCIFNFICLEHSGAWLFARAVFARWRLCLFLGDLA